MALQDVHRAALVSLFFEESEEALVPMDQAPVARPAPAAEEPGALLLEVERAPARAVRVNVETLDRILDLTGEIAVERGRLREALETASGGARGSAAELHREADRLHTDLQE